MKDHVSRRDFIKKTAAVAALVLAGPASVVLNAGEAFAKPKVDKKNKIAPIIKADVKEIGGKEVIWVAKDSAEYKELMLPKIHLPLIAQNGGLVPLTIDSKHPMEKGNYIKAFHVFDLNNPVPKIATFNLTPENGKAYISTRCKIQQDSYVQVVSEYSNGKMYGSKDYLKVTVGGC
jgi:sulfur-oxidizing protein SoxY